MTQMMRRAIGSLLLATAPFAAPFGAVATADAAEPTGILPAPVAAKPGTGRFVLSAGARIAYPADDRAAAATARLLAAHIAAERGLVLSPTPAAPAPAAAIRLVRDAAITGDEAYRLTVTPAGIVIAASGDRGLIHGAMSLAQLASPDRAFGTPVAIAAVTIDDAPRFGWRGLLLDPVRHFLPIDAVRTIVDQMASVKLNTLHLHLTDDQGWRFEVKRFPKLTAIGAWRTPPSTGGAPGPKVGGFYTQAELRDLVTYARERGITIVPEIDLPGHAQALVAAYPELGILGDRPAVSHDWGVNPYLFNPGPQGIAFVKAVLDEVIDIFPGQYIHLGGDEAVKDQWERSPQVQAQIRALGLKDENGLQSWMIEQFSTYLAAKGRRLIGWDEILEGGLPPSASIMSWRGEQGAVAAANAGHDVVLSPAPALYLDNLQSDHGDEPPGRMGYQTLAAMYAYDPMPAGIGADKAHHVLGAQGNAWSEYLMTPYQVQHNIFPRAAAIAEFTWSPKDKRDFAGFLPRVDAQAQRWRRSGVEVADSAFAVAYTLAGTAGDALRARKVTVALGTQADYGTIRYTLDGSAPTLRSPVYAAPLVLAHGVRVQAAAFDAAGNATAAARGFDTARAALLTRTASDMVACPGGPLVLRVPLSADATANAPAFDVNLFDTCTADPAVPPDVAAGYTIEVARLPRPYGLAHETNLLRQHYAVSEHGELLVQVGCAAAAKRRAAGDATARALAAGAAGAFPLPDPATAPQRFSFTGTLPTGTGDTDVCFQFTSPLSDPFYAVERVTLTERK